MTQTIRRDETYDRAVDRLRDMIAATKSPLEKDIGELITEALPGLGDVGGLLNEKKDLKGAADALTAHAREQAGKAHGVYVRPGEALQVLLKYFGIEAGTDAGEGAALAATSGCRFRCEAQEIGPRSCDAPEGRGAADPLNMDALLGGL